MQTSIYFLYCSYYYYSWDKDGDKDMVQAILKGESPANTHLNRSSSISYRILSHSLVPGNKTFGEEK